MRDKKPEAGDIGCPECGKRCKPMTVDVADSHVRGWRCQCGYELISPAEIERAYLMMKAKNHERVKISKRGNSYMITIPKSIADAINIKKIKSAEIYLEDESTISIKF